MGIQIKHNFCRDRSLPAPVSCMIWAPFVRINIYVNYFTLDIASMVLLRTVHNYQVDFLVQ